LSMVDDESPQSAPLPNTDHMTALSGRAIARRDHAPSCGVGAFRGPAQFALAEPREGGAAVRSRQLPVDSISAHRLRFRIAAGTLAFDSFRSAVHAVWREVRGARCNTAFAALPRVTPDAGPFAPRELEEPLPTSNRPLTPPVAFRAPPRRLQPNGSLRALAPTPKSRLRSHIDAVALPGPPGPPVVSH